MLSFPNTVTQFSQSLQHAKTKPSIIVNRASSHPASEQHFNLLMQWKANQYALYRSVKNFNDSITEMQRGKQSWNFRGLQFDLYEAHERYALCVDTLLQRVRALRGALNNCAPPLIQFEWQTETYDKTKFNYALSQVPNNIQRQWNLYDALIDLFQNGARNVPTDVSSTNSIPLEFIRASLHVVKCALRLVDLIGIEYCGKAKQWQRRALATLTFDYAKEPAWCQRGNKFVSSLLTIQEKEEEEEEENGDNDDDDSEKEENGDFAAMSSKKQIPSRRPQQSIETLRSFHYMVSLYIKARHWLYYADDAVKEYQRHSAKKNQAIDQTTTIDVMVAAVFCYERASKALKRVECILPSTCPLLDYEIARCRYNAFRLTHAYFLYLRDTEDNEQTNSSTTTSAPMSELIGLLIALLRCCEVEARWMLLSATLASKDDPRHSLLKVNAEQLVQQAQSNVTESEHDNEHCYGKQTIPSVPIEWITTIIRKDGASETKKKTKDDVNTKNRIEVETSNYAKKFDVLRLKVFFILPFDEKDIE